MQRQSFPILVLALTLSAGSQAASTQAPVFGSVVAIGGAASDIALDETHGVLYVANFAGSAIDVISLADNSILSSFSALPYPGSIAVSPGGTYLLAAHYGNGTTTPQGTNAITAIHLADNTRQVFNMTDPPLAVAFLGTGQAVVVTTTSILTMDPASGTTTVLGTFANLANTLPVAQATFPGQILQAALATSADGNNVWGVGAAGTANQIIYRYNAPTGSLTATIYITSPALLPRVSSAADGSSAMVGYILIGAAGYLQGRYPNVLSSTNITGAAVDSAHSLIYGQFPDQTQPTSLAGTTSGAAVLPSMLIMDSDNLTVRERITIPEDMVGRAVLNAAGTVLYAISESGVMILPVGSLNTYHRVAAGQEDIFVATNFCNGGVLSQSLTLTDPGGGQTDFTISTTQAGVTISPSSGTTPATVQVQVDPTAFPSGGTTTVTLNITSATAVNRPPPVRLLVNKPDPSQRGTIVDQPGVLSDILPDPARNRFYVLRQDKNKVLVFDRTSQSLIATLRTATTPTMMSFTNDRNFLMVGHNDSQLVTVYDLNALAPSAPIVLPGGHYARSIAQSTAETLVLARNEFNQTGVIDSVNFAARTAPALGTLGIYKNAISPTGVLTSSPSGGSILLASPDGNVMLYTASANTFVASRDDLTMLSGAFAASDFNAYVVGNTIFDASLVPTGTLSLPTSSSSSGFAFTGQGGYLASAISSSSPGTLQLLGSLQGGTPSSVTMAEAPLLPVAAPSATSGSTSEYVVTSFSRTLAPMPSSGTVVVLTTSGFTVMAPSYPSVPAPSISSLVSLADGNTSVAPGELVSLYGQNLSQVTIGGGQIPLATSLGDVCLSANNTPVPLVSVSSGQINAQLPFSLSGSVTLNVHTPGGISGDYALSPASAAPSVFRYATAGPETGLPSIIRDDDNQPVTPTNPIHPKDWVTIYLTGMGQTFPPAVEGQAAPLDPLELAAIQPSVTLGGLSLGVAYAGLAPGEVGVYQINVLVPGGVPQGLSIPLVINQGGAATTLYVRVVN